MVNFSIDKIAHPDQSHTLDWFISRLHYTVAKRAFRIYEFN